MTAIQTTDLTRPTRLTCCCCGASTIGRQWWNRDTDYGLCDACIPLCHRGSTDEDMTSRYGIKGVHYNLPA